jgi:enoyl-CoA hydratase
MEMELGLPPYKTLIVDRRGDAEWLTLNRPARLNALSFQMVDELCDYFGRLAGVTTPRVIVMQGAGRAFCPGFDIKEGLPSEETESDTLMRQRRYTGMIALMRRCPQPIIALVRGAAAGGGLSLALAADIRLAGESARMSAAYIRMGFSGADMGSSYFLPRQVGLSNASEILMTGRVVDADRALRIGLVSEVHPDDRLEAAGEAMAQDMLAASRIGLLLTKEALNVNIDAAGLEAAASLEDRNQLICAATPEVQEGIAAFLGRKAVGT